MGSSGNSFHTDYYQGLSIVICELCHRIQKCFDMSEERKSRGYWSSVVGCHCPRCRDGKLFQNSTTISFKKNMLMNKACPVCGQATEVEVGFYYGTSYVSYALTVGLSLVSLGIWALTIGLSTDDNRFFIWMGVNAALLILLQPWLMRFSRSLWISWFIKYDPKWKEHHPVDFSERMNADQANNW
jgi:uncharacterized protein (DUF983 family)